MARRDPHVARAEGLRRERAEQAKAEFDEIFRNKGLPEDIPVYEFKWDGPDALLVDIAAASGLTQSKGEARRLIKQGGLKVDNEKASSVEARLNKGEYLIQAGKRRFARIK